MLLGEDSGIKSKRNRASVIYDDVPEPDEDEKYVKPKGKKHLDRKLARDQELINLRKMQELVHNSDAHKKYEDDALFKFMILCKDQKVSAMALLEKFGDKRIMLDGLKIDGKIWDALAQTIN